MSSTDSSLTVNVVSDAPNLKVLFEEILVLEVKFAKTFKIAELHAREQSPIHVPNKIW